MSELGIGVFEQVTGYGRAIYEAISTSPPQGSSCRTTMSPVTGSLAVR
jgi:hypothetical protein